MRPKAVTSVSDWRSRALCAGFALVASILFAVRRLRRSTSSLAEVLRRETAGRGMTGRGGGGFIEVCHARGGCDGIALHGTFYERNPHQS